MTSLANRFSICAGPVFVVCLTLLLANDLYLKAAHPGWVTGKLSDFAGLIVLGLLLFSLSPKHVRTLAWLLAVAFVWWKSPLSAPAIEIVNDWKLVRVGRIVDYTDLVALAVIPLSVHHFEARNLGRLPAWRRLLLLPSIAGAAFAVAATSAASYTRVFVIQSVERRTTAVSEADVERVLGSLVRSEPLECQPSAAAPGGDGRICLVDGIWLAFSVADGRASFRIIEGLPPFSGTRRKIRRVDELVDAIKRAFTDQIDGLEYVEPLVSPTSPMLRVEPAA